MENRMIAPTFHIVDSISQKAQILAIIAQVVCVLLNGLVPDLSMTCWLDEADDTSREEERYEDEDC